MIVGILLAAAVLALGVAVAGGRRSETGWRTMAVSAAPDVALVSSAAAIFAITLVPMGGAHEVELLPFRDVVEALKSPIDLSALEGEVFNILLFVPLGAALAVRGLAIGRTAISAFALSAAVEISQLLYVSGRTASTDDLVLNTVGAVLGHVMLSTLAPRARARPQDT